jgi:Rv2632c-like
MNMAEDWSIRLTVGELDGETHAEARLIMDDDHLFGRGTARRNPADRNVTKIGEEIAVARALSDLAH